MHVIYKYPLLPAGGLEERAVSLPLGAKVLSLGLDPGRQLCVWADVDPAQPLAPVPFAVRFTGQCPPTGPGWRFLGTVLQDMLMLHVWVGGAH